MLAKYFVLARMWPCLLPCISSRSTSLMSASIESACHSFWYATYVGCTNFWKRSTISSYLRRPCAHTKTTCHMPCDLMQGAASLDDAVPPTSADPDAMASTRQRRRIGILLMLLVRWSRVDKRAPRPQHGRPRARPRNVSNAMEESFSENLASAIRLHAPCALTRSGHEQATYILLQLHRERHPSAVDTAVSIR